MALAARCMRVVLKLPTGTDEIAGDEERAAKREAERAGRFHQDAKRIRANEKARRARGVLRFESKLLELAAERFHLAVDARFAVNAYERGEGTRADVLTRINALAEFLDCADDAGCVRDPDVPRKHPAPKPIGRNGPRHALDADARDYLSRAIRSRSQLRNALKRDGDEFLHDVVVELFDRLGGNILVALATEARDSGKKGPCWTAAVQAADAVRKRMAPTSTDAMNRKGRLSLDAFGADAAAVVSEGLPARAKSARISDLGFFGGMPGNSYFMNEAPARNAINEVKLTKPLDAARRALVRALAGLSIYGGTRAAIEAGLAAIEAEGGSV